MSQRALFKVATTNRSFFNTGILALGILGLVCAATRSPANEQERINPSDANAGFVQLMDQKIPEMMSSTGVVGVVASVVKDGELFWAGGYGLADQETNTTVDVEQTLFRPGSISKVFTWTGIMRSGVARVPASLKIPVGSLSDRRKSSWLR